MDGNTDVLGSGLSLGRRLSQFKIQMVVADGDHVLDLLGNCDLQDKGIRYLATFLVGNQQNTRFEVGGAWLQTRNVLLLVEREIV